MEIDKNKVLILYFAREIKGSNIFIIKFFLSKFNSKDLLKNLLLFCLEFKFLKIL